MRFGLIRICFLVLYVSVWISGNQIFAEGLNGLRPDNDHEPFLRFPPRFQPFLMPPFTQYGFIQITYKKRLLPPLLFGLFGRECPVTVKNFIALLDGHHVPETERSHGIYKGTMFYRVIPNVLIQGGRVIHPDGQEGLSIYPQKYFSDETFCVKHDRPGVLSMSSLGPDMNGSEFFITAHRAPCLDQKYVTFGLIIYGLDTLQFLTTQVKVIPGLEMPHSPIVIYDCGTDIERKLGMKTTAP